MSCNNITTTQGYLVGDDPQVIDFGCMPSGVGVPTEAPNPDEIPFYFDTREEVLYYYTCYPEMWTKVHSSISDLDPVDISKLPNPSENLKVPVTYKVGNTIVEGLVPLGDLIKSIIANDGEDPVLAIERNDSGDIVATHASGKKSIVEQELLVSDVTFDNNGDMVVTKNDGTKTTIPAKNINPITDFELDGKTLVLTQGKQKFRVNISDAVGDGSAGRPINFAPSANGDNIEITLADGSVLDMTRQEFAEWLAGKDSPIATDKELRDAIAGSGSNLQEQIDALQKQLDAFNTDQATLVINSGNLVLTNDDGSKSTIPLSNLIKVSAAAGNAAEVRTDGIYVPTVQGGGGGFDKISPDANNIIVNKANGLYAPKTTLKGGSGVTIIGKGTPEDPFVITGSGGGSTVEGYLPKDVGVSCDPAIQMNTAVKVDTIATWASPAVITSTKGDTYSHSLIAHGEYESEDSIQWIASLDVVSPKQINFTVFHPELNYRANYDNGHVYLDVGLRKGQTFDGNKEIVFDVTEGECDDNVVGWVDGKKIYGRDIKSPKFGDSDVNTREEIAALRHLPFNAGLFKLYSLRFTPLFDNVERVVTAYQTTIVRDPDDRYLAKPIEFYFLDTSDSRVAKALNFSHFEANINLDRNKVDFNKRIDVEVGSAIEEITYIWNGKGINSSTGRADFVISSDKFQYTEPPFVYDGKEGIVRQDMLNRSKSYPPRGFIVYKDGGTNSSPYKPVSSIKGIEYKQDADKRDWFHIKPNELEDADPTYVHRLRPIPRVIKLNADETIGYSIAKKNSGSQGGGTLLWRKTDGTLMTTQEAEKLYGTQSPEPVQPIMDSSL